VTNGNVDGRPATRGATEQLLSLQSCLNIKNVMKVPKNVSVVRYNKLQWLCRFPQKISAGAGPVWKQKSKCQLIATSIFIFIAFVQGSLFQSFMGNKTTLHNTKRHSAHKPGGSRWCKTVAKEKHRKSQQGIHFPPQMICALD